MKYQVTITETLEMVVEIEATSPEEAEEKVHEQWEDADFVLGAEEFAGVEFKALPICPKCGNMYSGRPAISREDNCTEICPSCGVREALEATGLSGKLQNEILSEVNNLHK